MTDDTHRRFSEAAMDLLALRKAAALAHWVHGVHLVLSGASTPTVAVTCDETMSFEETCLVLHPCEFRRQVLQLMASDAAGLGPSFGLGESSIHIGVLSSPGTDMDDRGLVVTDIDGTHAAVVHVIAGEQGPRLEGTTSEIPESCYWPLNNVPVLESVDPDLGVVLLSCAFQHADNDRARAAYTAILDAMVTATAEEITVLLGA
ncbi:MAG: hypothetical protein AAF962_24995 [Actinomycetota bacterium]